MTTPLGDTVLADRPTCALYTSAIIKADALVWAAETHGRFKIAYRVAAVASPVPEPHLRLTGGQPP